MYYHHFQPIIGFNQSKVFGYEGLLRSKHITSPYELFCTAIDYNCLLELDVSSFRKAIYSFSKKVNKLNKDSHIFINIYPSTLVSALFMEHLTDVINKGLISPEQIILEISESERIADYERLKNTIRKIKNIGVKIALDDMDKGNAPLRNVLELEPDYVKFDKYFSDDLKENKKKQDLLASLLQFCKVNNIKTILEGIETKEDYKVAKSIGIHFGQGYLLGRPSLKLQPTII